MIAILALIGAWFLGCFALLCAYGLGISLGRVWQRRRGRKYMRKLTNSIGAYADANRKMFNSTEWP